MLADSRPVGFVPAEDIGRARGFYEGVLGLPLVADVGFACIFRIGDTTLRVTHADGLKPQPFTVFGWEVEDITASLAELRARGVDAERFDGMEQEENGVWRPPSGALVAWFKDSEGNVLSLTQNARPT